MGKMTEEHTDKLWNSNYCKVMAANFALFFAFYLLTPLLPLYMNETFHASKGMTGMVLSGYTLTAMLFRPFSGYVVDSFQRKHVLMVCYCLFFVFFAGYLAAGTLLLFAVVRTLHGGPFGALTVANSTVAIDVLPSSRRNEGIGYYGLSNNIAMATAPSVAIFVYDSLHSFDVLFWTALVVAGIGMAIDSTVKLNPRAISVPDKKMSLDRFFLTNGWLPGLNIVTFGCCFGILSTYIAIYGKEVLGITGGTGAYFMILAVGLILSRLQGSKALRQGKLVSNAALGVVLSLAGYVAFVAMPGGVGYYGSAFLIGLGNGHMWPAFQNMFINLATNAQRGTANSTILISWDVGMGLGVLAGGLVSGMCGYTSAFWLAAAMQGVGVALFFAAVRSYYAKHKLR